MRFYKYLLNHLFCEYMSRISVRNEQLFYTYLSTEFNKVHNIF